MTTYDDPNSRLCSDRARRDRQYARWIKAGQYEALLRDYLKNRCAAPVVWQAFEALLKKMRQA